MKLPQLFLLHFAGGSCYSYQFLIPFLYNFEVITLELPGRGRRSNEPLLEIFEAAAADVYQQIKNKLNGNSFFIYGHSMGAFLSLRIANMLEHSGEFPSGLIVSGSAGPGIYDPNLKARHLMNKLDFIRELKLLGGIPSIVFENREMFDFFEPILRADFKISEKNGLDEEPAILTQIFALMGSEEKNVDNINNWARFTKGLFRFEILEGDHFFIHKHPSHIADIITNFLQ